MDRKNPNRQQSLLYRTVRAAILDWESQYDPMRYRGKIPDGAVFNTAERTDLTTIICFRLKELATLPEQKKSPARVDGAGGGNGRR